MSVFGGRVEKLWFEKWKMEGMGGLHLKWGIEEIHSCLWFGW